MNSSDTQTLIIVLATVVLVILIGAVGCFLYRRSRQRRRHFLFLKRGITPIDDEEIESWKTAKSAKSTEKMSVIESSLTHDGHELEQQRQQHQQHQQQSQHAQQPEQLQHLGQKSTSFSSIRKPPSVIIYQHPQNAQYPHPRVSDELSPRSLYHKRSIDMPPAAALARAPNSRPGLTDDMIQGDDAFISPMKRQPSRLAKTPPSSSRHGRTRSSRSSTVSAFYPQDPWHGHYPHSFHGIRKSSDYIPRANRSLDIRRHHQRMHSMTDPSRMSFDDEVFFGGLSPRPLIRKSEIGMAIG